MQRVVCLPVTAFLQCPVWHTNGERYLALLKLNCTLLNDDPAVAISFWNTPDFLRV